MLASTIAVNGFLYIVDDGDISETIIAMDDMLEPSLSMSYIKIATFINNISETVKKNYHHQWRYVINHRR